MSTSALRTAQKSLKSLVYHAQTMYLFTKADIPVVILPNVCLAVTSGPLASPSHLVHVVFWIWLHTLALDLSNQTLDLVEDAHNKPYRPIPAGRISYRAACVLRWVLPLVCWAWSASYSLPLLYASIANCLIVVLYDEMGGAAGHWLYRNILNSIGHASIEVGACLLAGNDVNVLHPTALRAILCSACIILLTIHAQDFKDAPGDALVGRRTLPIVHPKTARPTLLVLMVASSIALSVYWRLVAAAALAFVAFGSAIGWLFFSETTKEADKRHLSLYMIWLSVAHTLPAYSNALWTASLF
ncbi:hypothetical protein DENSPDRAFT_850967 [Dentipellis sp. KUC8613]|nr:hypothetical protein DENSPDRAFT_850967 [Dentipellis sp. KUC8613]